MISTAKAPSGLVSSFFDFIIHAHPASLLSGRSTPTGPSPEELTAHLAPHLRVDMGLADPHTAGLGAEAPTSRPLVPPVSAMHRCGDWGGRGGAGPSPASWAWPLRV